MYNIEDELLNIEYQIYGKYHNTFLKIDDIFIKTFTDLKIAYQNLKVDDNIYKCMKQQFTTGKITTALCLTSFYNNSSVTFNKLYIDMTNLEYCIIIKGNNISSMISNSILMGADGECSGINVSVS